MTELAEWQHWVVEHTAKSAQRVDVKLSVEGVGVVVRLFENIVHQLKELKTMSGTLDDRLASLTALATKERDDNAKFRADVAAAFAAIPTAGLTAEQIAAFDNLEAIVTATDQATLDADAALPAAPVPVPDQP